MKALAPRRTKALGLGPGLVSAARVPVGGGGTGGKGGAYGGCATGGEYGGAVAVKRCSLPQKEQICFGVEGSSWSGAPQRAQVAAVS